MERANFIRRIGWTVTLILGITLFGGLVPQAQAATLITPGCGDTIGPGGEFLLVGDVGPCDDDTGSVVLTVDSAKLDMGGFTVSCNDTDIDTNLPNGIDLVGKKSELVNGTVRGCRVGVLVRGDGKHTVINVTARDSSEDGFYFESGGNQLTNNNANLNNGSGFYMISSSNKLSSNQAHKNNGDGFFIGNYNPPPAPPAAKNQLKENIATGNGNGFEIDTNANDNKLTKNYSLKNYGDGIRIVSGGSNNDVLTNTATDNNQASVGAFDLNDGNASCDGNSWKKNTFNTDSEGDGPGAGCIQ